MKNDRPEIKYIGKKITYISLRNLILDYKLTENDTVILNSNNFDEIVIEYLDFYGVSMTFPHFLLGVLIRESEKENIPIDRVGVLKNDENSFPNEDEKFEPYDGEVIYRCEFCGNIVDINGIEIEGSERKRVIYLIENLKNVIVKRVNGKCCPIII